MSRYVIIGGRGKVALRLSRLLSQRGDHVYSLVRNAEQSSDIRNAGALPVLASIEDCDVQELVHIFTGADAVIFSAGAGGKGGRERTFKVDYEGCLKAADAAEKVGTRFLLVSAMSSRPRSDYRACWDQPVRDKHDEVWKAIPDYLEAKLKADENIVARQNLKWTILRPGYLTDEKGIGSVQLGDVRGETNVTRDDVAATLAALLDEPASAGLALDLVQGKDPIEDAVAYAVKHRVSSFPN